MVVEGSSAKMYINGKNVGTCTNMRQRLIDLPTPVDLFIGKAQYPDPHPYLDAELDCFRVYNRALR